MHEDGMPIGNDLDHVHSSICVELTDDGGMRCAAVGEDATGAVTTRRHAISFVSRDVTSGTGRVRRCGAVRLTTASSRPYIYIKDSSRYISYRHTRALRTFIQHKGLEHLCDGRQALALAMHDVPEPDDGKGLHVEHRDAFQFQLHFQRVYRHDAEAEPRLHRLLDRLVAVHLHTGGDLHALSAKNCSIPLRVPEPRTRTTNVSC